MPTTKTPKIPKELKNKTEDKKTKITMDDLSEISKQQLVPFTTGDVVEVEVLSKSPHKIIVDVAGLTTGIIPEKEFSYTYDDIKVGDKIYAYILNSENENGMSILSLKQADSEKVWETLLVKKTNNETIKVRIKSANRGGLIAEFGNSEGFLPVSQLSSSHYPKVEGGNQSLILRKLQELVNLFLEVKVITVDKNSQKLIFSEKSVTNSIDNEDLESFTLGQIVDAKITGIVDFGLFVTIQGKNNPIGGLIHYTEISWKKDDQWSKKFKIGEIVKAMITSLKNGRIALSIKSLEPNPWEKISHKYKSGDKIKAEVTSITPFGAFVKITDNIEGLVHISNLGKDIADPHDVLENNKKYNFEILSIDLNQHKISLKLVK
ncbi:MAG: RNA binding S1 protein [Candidatus Berkelbacteria bacterium Licking1014_85]|uniref:RNA binding S1 protein n=1 Tax=Candidatus Berkelbacteria bacterium Licking1014_85 TaxID=2017148 RepID=A0A554LK58_9BACT|nr:MAG: RNA binding S1 protein [Candidatus Berkelbacteria bacterium Licking1014_85]